LLTLEKKKIHGLHWNAEGKEVVATRLSSPQSSAQFPTSCLHLGLTPNPEVLRVWLGVGGIFGDLIIFVELVILDGNSSRR
jgi:hypothetical protein